MSNRINASSAGRRGSRRRPDNNGESGDHGPKLREPAYVVHSTFGTPRSRGSRLSRPCDACRKRKTACVITSRPPCNFCHSRNILCRSATAAQTRDGNPPGTTSHPQSVARDNELLTWSATGVQSTEQIPLNPPGSPSPIRSLEENEGRSTYFIGPAAEQDSMLLGEFRYDILDEYQSVDANVVPVYHGSQAANDRPVNFLFLLVERTAAANRAIQTAADAIEAMVHPYGEHLVRLYFRHVHPVLPIIPKGRFLQLYASDRDKLPVCLRGAVYGLASVFWDCEDSGIEEPCRFTQDEVLDHAHAALRREVENPNTLSLTACLLLIHATPPFIDTIEEPTTWTLSAQATATAQVLGLHQDPSDWSIPPEEKRTRRKLWWAVYITECWSAVCYGHPPHIGRHSFNTLEPEMEDVQDGDNVPNDVQHLVDLTSTEFDVAVAARFLQMVKLARSLRMILDLGFQTYSRGDDLPDKTATEAKLISINTELRHWASLAPSCLSLYNIGQDAAQSSYNCPVHLSTYTTKVLLYRALMHPATKEAKSDPDSNLRVWLPSALAAFAEFTQFLSQITTHDLNGFWGRHARSQLITCANFLIYLFLMASERQDVEKAYRLLESFVESAQALKASGTREANIFLRPAALRLESFFLQAVDIMRSGTKHQVIAE